VYVRAVTLRVLTWNLYHGRAVPAAGRDLMQSFGAALAGWEWDVALLQEVPPWWPAALAAASGSTDSRMVLTSRNGALALRRAIAVRWPDLIKSRGGGANAILVRPGAGAVAEHRVLRLCRLPERRWLHAVHLDCGVWVGNLHATVHHDARARAEAAVAGQTMLAWAAGAPAVLGGDFNVRALELDGFTLAAGDDVDLVFGAGLSTLGAAEILHSAPLSDHAPLSVALR
jgi:endonuclease/exonuclease/phosphatase family metal-dependent hydrolase